MTFGSLSLSGIEGALVGLAILAFFIVRQFSTRRVASYWNILAPVALGYFGMQGIGQLDQTGWVLLALSSSLGIGLGFARGMTFHIWISNTREAFMRGTVLTLLLWVATFAAKAALNFAEVELGFAAVTTSTAEMLIPGAATLAAQSVVVYLRSQDERVAASA